MSHQPLMIGRYTIYLDEGRRYRASRPLAVEGLDVFPVSLIDLGTGQDYHVATLQSYEGSNVLVTQINRAIKEAGFG